MILTTKEAQHLRRGIAGLATVAHEIVVLNRASIDGTIQIALEAGGRVIQRDGVNRATQFNLALSDLNVVTNWLPLRDTDEELTPTLAAEIAVRLPTRGPAVDGVYCGRRMTFQGRLIRHGGAFPVRVLRLFRHGQCEIRWINEHIKVAGTTVDFPGEIIDDNPQPLTCWTDKHDKHDKRAGREAVDLLNLQYGLIVCDTVANLRGGKQVGVKRWLREAEYARLSGGFRAFAYFFYRYVIRLGFLDGPAGTAFPFLQGFCYRYLVDAKVAEVKRYMQRQGVDVVVAIRAVLGIEVEKSK